MNQLYVYIYSLFFGFSSYRGHHRALSSFLWYTVGSHLLSILCIVWIASQLVLVVKNLPASAGDARDMGSIPEWGRSPREGSGNPLQYSCLENYMDRGAWWATVLGLGHTKQLSRQQRCSVSIWMNEWHSQHQRIWTASTKSSSI